MQNAEVEAEAQNKILEEGIVNNPKEAEVKNEVLEVKMQNRLFYCDRVTIKFSCDTGFIANRIDMAFLKATCKKALLHSTKTNERKNGYRSKIDMTVPTIQALQQLEEFIKELANDKRCKNITHIISYIEIAEDDLYPTIPVAESKAIKMMECVRMLNARKYFYYDDEQKSKEKKEREKKAKKASANESFITNGLFSDLTCYCGGRKSNKKFVIYSRISKIAGCPCVHKEFRLKGSDRIKQLIGIGSISDLLHANIEKSFLELKEKSIRFEQVDFEALGRFILNMRKDAKSPGVIMTGKHAGEMRQSPRKVALHYKKAYELNYTSNLRVYIMEKAKEIRKQIAKGKAITDYQKRIINMTQQKLNSLFVAVDEPI